MTKKEQQFVTTVREYHKRCGRHDLPWRTTTDPYRILVSELMLQQTQVERVRPKYEAFLSRWPTVRELAQAPLADVLEVWQGLGYNRRAKFLHSCAKQVVEEYQGVFPTTYDNLLCLPGIGPYTAGAVMAFAYNEPVALIETNIRTVFLHHFFSREVAVSDKEILQKVARTLPSTDVRTWYAALMDYGVHLKKQYGNLNRLQSKEYNKQSTFKGSRRQLRGAVVRLLTNKQRLTISEFVAQLPDREREEIESVLADLCREAIIVKQRAGYQLAT